MKRELGMRDVTLLAIACMVGPRWIASAAHAGPGTIVLWLGAALLFLIPLAIAVARLTVRQPHDGGLYVWTRTDFGPWHGFLAFWVYWMGIAFWFPSAALFYVSISLTAIGISASPAVLIAAALAALWFALGTNIVGVRIGKWTENSGAAASWVLGAILIAAALLAARRHGSATPLQLAPRFDWDTIAFWSAIAYAMSGFEMLGLMGGEIRDPARSLPRAAWVSSFFATIFYAGSTLALVMLVPAGKISEIDGLAQAGRAASAALGGGWRWITPTIALLVLISAMGQFGGMGATVSRLPFAAGTDHLLPRSFALLHPRWGTPWVSMLTLGAVASVLMIASQAGDTLRAGYQTMVSLMVIAGFLPYIYIFASSFRLGARVSSIAGLFVTVVAILASLVPTAEIHRVWLFEAKLFGGTAAVIGSAWLVYRRGRKAVSESSVAEYSTSQPDYNGRR
jgi:amino acid transporter